jgi:LysR family transcriptional regulator for metE and metH
MMRPHPDALEARDLRLVRGIVDHGGLAKASEALHVTPSALSHRLADLELRLGTPLFSRVGKRLVLTPAGEALRDGAAAVLAAMTALEEAVRRTATLRQSVVRVATECYTCYHWLPRVLEQFEREHPRVEVRVVLAATRRAVAALVDGELDVAISDGATAGDRVRLHPLFSSRLVAVVAPAHPWASRGFVRAADFADQRVLRYPVPREHSTLLSDILAPAGVVPAGEETVELTEALIELARAGRGVATLADWAAAPSVARGDVVAIPIREPAALRRWHAVTRRQARSEPHLAAFVRALRRVEVPSLG